MQAGLAPGQVRRGLRKFREITDRVEAFLGRLGIHMIHGDPYAYHNAIELERLGYFYASGREMMLEIDREFGPGGRLFKKLDASTPFRQPGMEKTIRGRSWAIHDEIMDAPWFCPAMVRLVGRKSMITPFTMSFMCRPDPLRPPISLYRPVSRSWKNKWSDYDDFRF